MTTELILILLAVFLATAIGTIIANFIIRRKEIKQVGNLNIEEKVIRLSQEALKNNNEQFLTLAKQVLGAEKGNIKTDLEGKKSQISSLVEEIRRDIRKNEERLKASDEDRVRSFSALKQEMEEYKRISGDLKLSTDKLKSLLSNNQMRGSFGEQIAENLLKMAGFVIGQDYSANKTQNTESTRPDFTIYLPDKTKINVDVKFPYTSLIKSLESDNQEDKKAHFRNFKQDVKNKIKQVSSRDYINPAERTVDFVILFIPNEMIFSYIYDKMNDVWEEAMNKKVIMAGPFSFTAILRMVKQAYSNFRYQNNLHHIIGLIQQFDKEYDKFSESIDRLGDRIKSADKQFELVSTTRDRQLTRVIDKIKDTKISELNNVNEDSLKITE